VRGTNPGNNTLGFLAGTDLKFGQPAGVYGQSNNIGVVGVSNGSVGAGMLGSGSQNGTNFDPASGGTGVLGTGYIGVRGETSTGVAVLGRIFAPPGGGPALAGKFVGNVEVAGDISVDGDVLLTNRDLAEQFEVNSAARYQPGMLMVIGENGALEPCRSAYDKRAIGVISGAGTLRPAITLGSAKSHSATAPIALVGTAFCLVDADLGPVEPGDLLTSSPTLGHAMNAKDPAKSFGAIVGKALALLRGGRGLLPILITLQ
jgi:hypothetical protein